jgi:hypothetical protein
MVPSSDETTTLVVPVTLAVTELAVVPVVSAVMVPPTTVLGVSLSAMPRQSVASTHRLSTRHVHSIRVVASIDS